MAATVKIVIEVEPEIKEKLEEIAFKTKASKKNIIIGLIQDKHSKTCG